MLASASRRSVWNCLLASPSETTNSASSTRCASVRLMVDAKVGHWLNNSAVNKTEYVLLITFTRKTRKGALTKAAFQFLEKPRLLLHQVTKSSRWSIRAIFAFV